MDNFDIDSIEAAKKSKPQNAIFFLMLQIKYRAASYLIMRSSVAAVLFSWLERRASNGKVAGSMPELGITSLCPWQRHLTLIFYQALCVVWKTTHVSVAQRYIPKKKTNEK